METRGGAGEAGAWDSQLRCQVTSDWGITRTVQISGAVGKEKLEIAQGPRWDDGIIPDAESCLFVSPIKQGDSKVSWIVSAKSELAEDSALHSQ